MGQRAILATAYINSFEQRRRIPSTTATKVLKDEGRDAIVAD
jgi:hypothetical protein